MKTQTSSLEYSEFKEANAWLESASVYGIKLDLENIRILLEKLGNPHLNLKVIHVAGTNGKGSTCVMLTSILMEAGYSVGLYTSPHLVSPRERIQKNREWISEMDFASRIHVLREIVEKVSMDQPFCPTYFELMSALALKYFSDQKLDFIVLETGMGGRLDSTNIVPSKVQVITNIDLDHTQFLGSSVTQIAYEKAGIIKSNSMVITGANDSALTAIEQVSGEKKSTFVRLGHELHVEINDRSLDGQSINVNTANEHYCVHLNLLGAHQAENCALAIGAIEALAHQGYFIPKDAILKGLKVASWPGRFEIVSGSKNMILDAAHNPAGAEALVKTWREYFGAKKAHIIFSALKDKDVRSMAKILSQIASHVSIAELKTSRGMSQTELLKIWKSYLPEEELKALTIEEVIELMKSKNVNPATRQSTEVTPWSFRELILVTGSIYLLGEIRNILE